MRAARFGGQLGGKCEFVFLDEPAPPLESAFAAAPAEPVAVEADEPASSESLASAFAAASEPALADTA